MTKLVRTYTDTFTFIIIILNNKEAIVNLNNYFALFFARFHSIPEETLQEQRLLADDPHLPGGCQRLHWHDHLQAKVLGANLRPISLQGHFPHRYRAVADPHLL